MQQTIDRLLGLRYSAGMRYVMSIMNPTGSHKGTMVYAFKPEFLRFFDPITGQIDWDKSRNETTEEVMQRMLIWIEESSFGRQLDLEGISWSIYPTCQSSIIADLEEEQFAILRLAAPTKVIRFRKEEVVLNIVQRRQTKAERSLTEPMPVSKKPRLGPPPGPAVNYKIVKGPARRRHNLGSALPRQPVR